MAKRVLFVTRDLFFRSKLAAVAAAGGAEVTRDESQCDIAVIELGAPGAVERVGAFVTRRVQVLAFGSHVSPDALRAAREAGAIAVPNSQVEEQLRRVVSGGAKEDS